MLSVNAKHRPYSEFKIGGQNFKSCDRQADQRQQGDEKDLLRDLSGREPSQIFETILKIGFGIKYRKRPEP